MEDGEDASLQFKIQNPLFMNRKVLSEEEIKALEQAAEKEIDEAVEYAQKAPFPALDSALKDVFCEGGN